MSDIWIISNLNCFISDPQYIGFSILTNVKNDDVPTIVRIARESGKAILIEPSKEEGD